AGKTAAGEGGMEGMERVDGGQVLVIVSFRFRRARATAVQAASSASVTSLGSGARPMRSNFFAAAGAASYSLRLCLYRRVSAATSRSLGRRDRTVFHAQPMRSA